MIVESSGMHLHVEREEKAKCFLEKDISSYGSRTATDDTESEDYPFSPLSPIEVKKVVELDTKYSKRHPKLIGMSEVGELDPPAVIQSHNKPIADLGLNGSSAHGVDERCEKSITTQEGDSQRPKISSVSSDILDALDLESPTRRGARRRRSFFGSWPCTETSELPDVDSTPKKSSAPRRRSFFGSTHSEETFDQSALLSPTKSSQRRRRSLFASTPSGDVNDSSDLVGTKSAPSRRRRSFFGSTPSDDAGNSPLDFSPSGKESSGNRGKLPRSSSSEENAVVDDYLEEKKKTSSRRRNLLGSVMPPELLSPFKKNQKLKFCRKNPMYSQSSESDLSHYSKSTAASGETKDKNQSDDGEGSFSATVSWDGSVTKNQKSPFPRRRSLGVESLPTKKESVKMRFSRGHSLTGAETSPAKMEPEKTSLSRRYSLTGAVTTPTHKKVSEKVRHSRRHSLTGGVPQTTNKSESKPCSPYDLVTKSRSKRGLAELSRNMLMDTIARQVAQDLAASGGRNCTQTQYYGNVGQGTSVKQIHKAMMSEAGSARENILSRHFSEMGFATARGRDGLIYVCQLFN